MHTGTTRSRATLALHQGIDVQDSDFGAFADACPPPSPASSRADRLIAHARARCTVDGYTSYPAYADELERLIAGLMRAPGTGVQA